MPFFYSSSAKSLAILAFLLATSTGCLFAQETPPFLVTLQVTDPTGATIPYARIQMIPSPQPSQEAMETDAHGQLALDLKPGGYCVSVASSGFRKLEEHFDVQGPKTISLKLAAGSCTECVTVLAPAPNTLLLRTAPYNGHAPTILKPADLKALPHMTVTAHNPHTNAEETYSGVPLIDLLLREGMPRNQNLRGREVSEYVVATGSDGYEAVLSLAEVDPELHPGEVIVADTMDGQPLDTKAGPFRLVVTEDKRPARSVHSLVSIEVKRAE